MTDINPNSLPTRWLRVNHHSAEKIARLYLYAAFGSNLWLEQIGQRCPNAEIVGPGRLRGARLIFSRVASIVEDDNSDVLLGIYKLTAADIERMDRYEGMGRTYDRVLVTPEIDGNAVRCFTYIKRTNYPEAPTDKYFQKIVRGFKDWKFPDRRLYRAKERAGKEALRDHLGRKEQASFYSRWEPDQATSSARPTVYRDPPVSHVPGSRHYTPAPSRPKQWATHRYNNSGIGYVSCAANQVVWGCDIDGIVYFKLKNTSIWYRSVGTQADANAGLARGMNLAVQPAIIDTVDTNEPHMPNGAFEEGDTFVNGLGQRFLRKGNAWVRDKRGEN